MATCGTPTSLGSSTASSLAGRWRLGRCLGSERRSGECLSYRAAIMKAQRGQQLGSDHHANKKSLHDWMLFLRVAGVLRSIHCSNSQTIGLSSYGELIGTGQNGRPTSTANVRVAFLPANTTSKVQPLDAGIITQLKCRYNRRLPFHVVKNTEVGIKSISMWTF